MAVRRELSSSLQFPLRNSAVVDHERENINFEGQFHFDMDTDYKQTFGIGNGKCWNSMTGLTNQSDGLLNSNSNVTENVTVPSSFHVAEIVGKQGWLFVNSFQCCLGFTTLCSQSSYHGSQMYIALYFSIYFLYSPVS